MYEKNLFSPKSELVFGGERDALGGSACGLELASLCEFGSRAAEAA